MRVKLMIAILLGAGSAFVANAWQAQPAPQPQPAAPSNTIVIRERPVTRPAPLPALHELFDGYVAAKKMPGIVAAVGQGDVAPSFVAAGAISDDAGAPNANPDSLWRIYSMTKPITGIAAMLLVEDGKMQLDQPISDFIPAFKTMKVATSPDTSLDGVPATKPITVRMLLTHTAGLSYNISAKGPLLKEYERLGVLPASVNSALEVGMRAVRPTTLQEFANRAASLPLIAQPGTKWSYSISLDVMGAVIEKASGMDFEAFLQQRLFAPLKMRSTWFTVPASETARLSTNYAWAGANRIPLDPAATSVYLQSPSFPYGGAGLVSSARDYDRFLHMLANGGSLDGVRVMKPATVALAMSNLLPAGVTFGGIGGGTGGDPTAQGFGAGGSVYLKDVAGGASKGTYGWGGAAGTIAFVDPVRKLRGTVMVNYFPADKWPLRGDIVKALYADPRP